MTTIWCRSAAEEEYTEARILRLEEFESDFSVFSCMPVPGRYPNTTLEIILHAAKNEAFSGQLHSSVLSPSEDFSS
jgi:hypothetical protein